VLGPEHPNTLAILHNLARLLENQGDYAGAEPAYRRAVEGLWKISAQMQRQHPNLRTFIDNYARCLERLGRRPAEIQETLEAMMRPLGKSPA